MSVRFPHLAFETISNSPINTGEISPGIINQPAVKTVSPEIAPTAKTDQFEKTTQTYNTSSPINIIKPVVYPLKFIDEYVNRDVIQNAIEQNPRITEILQRNGVAVKISDKNIDERLKRHLFTTYLYSMEIAKQARLDRNTTAKVAQAALVHDIGKALIPEEILQKPGKLTKDEREIIRLHAMLGAEILKTTDIDPDVIDAIELHHKHKFHDRKSTSKISQILSVADVYSALKERRTYKDPLPDERAFALMSGMPQLSQSYVKNLCQHRYMTKLF